MLIGITFARGSVGCAGPALSRPKGGVTEAPQRSVATTPHFGCHRTVHPSTILCRTPAGEAELAAAAQGLSLTQRRFLTLLDTSCNVDQLALRHPADPEKFDRDVARLAQLGLITCEAPSSPDEASVAAVAGVRLGAPRFARRLSFALVTVVASALAWMAWQHLGPASSSKRSHASVTSTARAAETPMPSAIAPDPAAIATRVLRGDPVERAREAKDTHAGGAVAKTAVPKHAVEPVDAKARATTTPELSSSSSDSVSASVADKRDAPAERRPPREASPVDISDAVVAASTSAPAPAALTSALSAPITTAGSTAIPAPPASPAAPSPASPVALSPASPVAPSPALMATMEPRSSESSPVRLASAAPTAGLLRSAPPPKLIPILRDAPDFPREAIALGLASGTVKARLTVDAKGNVSNVDVVDASHRVFDRAVRDALARWRFPPGTSGRTTTVDVAFKRD